MNYKSDQVRLLASESLRVGVLVGEGPLKRAGLLILEGIPDSSLPSL